MNALQKFLKENNALQKDDVQLTKLFLPKKIKVSFEPGLILFKYDIDADFSDPVVENCRGDYSISQGFFHCLLSF